MQYLDPSEYVSFGLTAETSDDLVTAASAMIDSVCQRVSLGITQYVERLRFRRSGSVQLSYLPLAAMAAGSSPLVSVRVRMRAGCADPYHPLAFESGIFMPVTAGQRWTPAAWRRRPTARCSFRRRCWAFPWPKQR